MGGEVSLHCGNYSPANMAFYLLLQASKLLAILRPRFAGCRVLA